MFYYFFKYIDDLFHIPGIGVFKYISFRGASAAILSLLISIVLGKRLIKFFHKAQIKEEIRELDLTGQTDKAQVPTMGGIIIITATVVPTLLFAKLINVYVILLVTATLWMGLIGFLDDYIKVFRRDKKGLAGKFKIVGQVILGAIVGITLIFRSDVVVREFDSNITIIENGEANITDYQDVKTTKTTIPFLKNNELDYAKVIPWLGPKYTWIIYVLFVIFIIAAVSNGANITDGLDGLAAGSSAIIGTTLAILAYVSGNVIFSRYLNIMYIPDLAELTIFCTAFVGACVGFLWYNTYPAQIFMGDTGSLAIGSVIAVLAIVIRKELLIPLLCGVFLIENLSVIMQVGYFKYTKRKYGVGKRIFKMSPIHHHFQKLGLHEAKIVTRFWIVGIVLAILTLLTLKLR
ncbi:MAG: phospho-N-acetylmuramoyl-pentapeptide-transferase [Candidatus Amoebophilus sp. 36-38]|nr:MAG: phospho-N-acetylmuramoyl-pentapeptide-transferase [Candidatus Amoebophilus sp. 36-38]